MTMKIATTVEGGEPNPHGFPKLRPPRTIVRGGRSMVELAD
ncbi:MAG: hypothetical protein ACOYLN_13510 [Blastocatellia bacterium]